MPNETYALFTVQVDISSMIAASILKSRGIHNLIDVAGGFKAIKEAHIEVTDYICPSTL